MAYLYIIRIEKSIQGCLLSKSITIWLKVKVEIYILIN